MATTCLDEGKLPAIADQDPSVTADRMTYVTDWNGDGVNDTFKREFKKEDSAFVTLMTFTDGATGIATDITKYCATDDSRTPAVFENGVCSYLDDKGNQMILDPINESCSYFSTVVYTYDPDTIITYTKVPGYITYIDGDCFLIRHSDVFGNCSDVIFPASPFSRSIRLRTRQATAFFTSARLPTASAARPLRWMRICM